ncbi:MAG: MarR family transcriptional regulator, partial [Acidobacteriota bacterium]|nr:MarR family transcriptional regulator [Acidobacteriota bacterium]
MSKRANRQLADKALATMADQMERDLSAIRRALRKPLEAEVAGGELTAPQMAVMHFVVHNRGISLKGLSREASLAHSTVSGIVDRLEKRGMIVRRPDPADGRVSRIHPSAEVEEFVRKKIPMLAAGPLRAALERAAPEERAVIGSALRRLR